jgi:hypothetical protein
MMRLAPGGRHLAYEPLLEFAASLRRGFPTVEVREAALGDEPGEASSYGGGRPLRDEAV